MTTSSKKSSPFVAPLGARGHADTRARRPVRAAVIVACLVVLGITASAWSAETVPGAKWSAEIVPGAKWTTVAPDTAGWSAAKLKDADEFARTVQTDAYVIVVGGVMVHEYGATARATNVYSVRKSVLSVLMGIQVDRGVVNLDKTLADLVIVHRVYGEQPGRRHVSNKQFAELLERILAARSSGADPSR